MRLLLDIQVVVWSLFQPARLPRKAADTIRRASTIFVSSVSVFEIAIKPKLGISDSDFADVEARLRIARALPLPLTWHHARRSRDIATSHPDPHDRLPLSQAIVEPLYLLTTDARLADYSELVILVG